jgi:hypothetical protein
MILFNKILEIFLSICFVFYIYRFWRVSYVSKKQEYAINLLSDYIGKMPVEEYDFNYMYYNEWIYEFLEQVHDFKSIGKYSAFKPEYRERLIEFDKQRSNSDGIKIAN